MSPLRGEHPDRNTYNIIRRLDDGRGDFVYLANHEIFGEHCVQKTVRMHGLEDALANSEPAFLNQLKHDQIVPVREAQWDRQGDQAITFVMPLFAGGSVNDALLEDYRFSVTQAIGITIDALDALDYLHQEFDALHRDTKPGNVVLDAERQRGYLSDFGSAAKMGGDGLAAAVLGTTIYRPPEARRVGTVGADADVFGIGMMLFEMLSGRIPWEQLDLQVVETRLQKGQRAIPDGRLVFPPHVPERLRRCVRKAIHRNAMSRFRGPSEFIRALRAVRCIDWAHVEGAGLEGEWRGTWPARLALSRRTSYRVRSYVLGGGPNRGQLRIESDYRAPGKNWRQAIADVTLDPADAVGVAGVFDAVQAKAAQRSPAR